MFETASTAPAPEGTGPFEIVDILEIGHKGDGVADTADGRVFVSGSLPGERVRIERSGERGRVVEILTPSPDRVQPPCPHFGICGGCALQHMAEPAYLEMKRQQVVAAMHDRGIDAPVGAVVPVGPQSRRRAVIAAQRTPAGMMVGFRARLSHTVVPITGCLVVTPAIEAALPKLAKLADKLSFDKKGAIFTVLDSETGLDVAVTEAKYAPNSRQEIVALTIALGFARLSIGREVLVEARAPVVRFGDVIVAVAPGAFVQAVAPAEAALAAMVLAATAGAKRIADLFAGCGTFALRMARTAHVQAVEADAPALEALSKAARHSQGLKPVTVETRDLSRRPMMAKELEKCDAVVFDPPRDGAAPQAKELAKSKVKKIVAVSCNPATLARDARYLIDGGYRLTQLTPVDQFLWSHHIEIVAVFERA